MSEPKLKDTVGGKGAKNDPDDVKTVQDLLNKAVLNGDLSGLSEVPVTGAVTPKLLEMIRTYQQRNGFLKYPTMKAEEVLIEPGKGTFKALVANPLVSPRWSAHDETIKKAIQSLNERFKGTPGFKPLDWRWVKAMAWQETGANSGQWDAKPLQIGNKGDPGLSVVKGGNSADEKAKVKAVVPKELQEELKKGMTAELNIKAGVAYLFYIAARPRLKFVTVIDDPTPRTYTLQDKEFPSTVAGKLKTTADVILKDSGLTPESVRKLPKKATIKYRLAHTEYQVGGWGDWEAAIKEYNGGGVKHYLEEVKARYEKIVKVFAE